MTDIQMIASRYRMEGVTEQMVEDMVHSGLARGFSRETALVGAKLALSIQYGKETYFTAEEAAAALGCSLEAARAVLGMCNEM